VVFHFKNLILSANHIEMNEVENLLEKTKSVLKTFSEEEVLQFQSEIIKYKLENSTETPKKIETHKFEFSSEDESEEELMNSDNEEENEKIKKNITFDFQMETQILNFKTNSKDKSSLDYKNIIIELIQTKKYKTFEQLPDNFKNDFKILQ
jgi:N-methylhydantoinase B/oxoprolinase/acetone carboxylase alpha subunit